MNRSNIGNVVTNATQVMSVGAFTAGGYRRQLAKADKTLNNVSEEERMQQEQYKKDKQRVQRERFYAGQGSMSKEENELIGSASAKRELRKADEISRGVDDAFQRLTPGEQLDYREAQAEGMRQYTKKMAESDEESGASVDDLMEGASIEDVPEIEENSEQSSEINTKMSRDVQWLEKQAARRKKNTDKTLKAIKDTGGVSNADVRYNKHLISGYYPE